MKAAENYVTPAQRQAIEDAVPTLGLRKWRPVDVQWAFRIAYWCGLRMAEVPGLRARSFDWEGRQVYLGQTKTKANYAAVPEFAIPYLRSFWDDRLAELGDTELLPGCTTKRIYRWLRQIGRDLDIEALTTPQVTSGEKAIAHIFRKSLAKDMLAGTFGKKAGIGEVQAQLRHSNPVMTGRYLRLGGQAASEFWGEVGAAAEGGAAAGEPADTAGEDAEEAAAP